MMIPGALVMTMIITMDHVGMNALSTTDHKVTKMNDYHLNFFRPYSNNCRNEISVTRAFIITCAKSANGNELLQRVLRNAGLDMSFIEDTPKFGLEMPGDLHFKETENFKKAVLCISPNDSIAYDGILTELYSSHPGVLSKFSDRKST